MPQSNTNDSKLKKLRSIILEFQETRDTMLAQDPALKKSITDAVTSEEQIRIDTLKNIYQQHTNNLSSSNSNLSEISRMQNITLLQIEDIKIGAMMRTLDVSKIAQMMPERARNLATANQFSRYNAQHVSFACLG